eukprot:7056757-Alexandrium_andersonii.AAC.1
MAMVMCLVGDGDDGGASDAVAAGDGSDCDGHCTCGTADIAPAAHDGPCDGQQNIRMHGGETKA